MSKRNGIRITTPFTFKETRDIHNAASVLGAKSTKDYVKFAVLKMNEIIFHQRAEQIKAQQEKVANEKETVQQNTERVTKVDELPTTDSGEQGQDKV